MKQSLESSLAVLFAVALISCIFRGKGALSMLIYSIKFITDGIMLLLKTLMDLFFPSRCVVCGVFVRWDRNFLCSECLGKIKLVQNSCIICSSHLYEGECAICSDRKFYPKKNICLFEYQGVVKNIIHSLKFDKIKGIYKNLIPFADEVLERIIKDVDYVTFVPMNSKKEKKRGYNQSKLIALAFATRYKIRCFSFLKEVRSSGIQREMDYTERFINVIDRYDIINHKRIKNSRIIIVDDVFTTGATINECARKLLDSGALEVFSLTIARSDLKKLDII